jgi:hypothetical protein
MAVLSGAAVGSATGGIIGGFLGLGIPEYEAQRYEGNVRAGNFSLGMHTEDGRCQTNPRAVRREGHWRQWRGEPPEIKGRGASVSVRGSHYPSRALNPGLSHLS